MRIVIFIPSFGDGGVERMLVNMAVGLAEQGVRVVFMVGRMEGPHLDRLTGKAEVEHFPAGPWLMQVARLWQRLRRDPVDAVLAAKLSDGSVAVTVKRLLRYRLPVVLRPGTAVSERMADRSVLTRWRKLSRVRRVYIHADAVVANSKGVRADIASVTGIAEDQIGLIRNPVITPEFEAMAREPATHEWVTGESHQPVILGVGGLRRQKDFETLIRAFALVRARRHCRLLILGEGQRRDKLEELAVELGVSEDVALPGFVANPYPIMAAADVFVLSSRWEGSPNVLTEALALGTPVVATDCRSGPGEILDGGLVAPLVPVGDEIAIAEGIERMLTAPPARETLRQAVVGYTMEANATAYRALFHSLQDSGKASHA